MVVCPALALGIHHSFRELKELIWKSFDLKSAPMVGYVLAILIMPFVLTLTFFVMRSAGIDLPPIQTSLHDIMFLAVFFFIGAALEEIGWTGYATNALLKRNGILYTGLIVGVVWAIWHLIPYIQMEKELHWIFWQGIASVLKRIVMVGLFLNYGRNVFITILFHMQINLSVFVFPTMGSHYSPFYFSLVFLGAIAVGLIGLPVLKIMKLKTRKPKKPDN